MLVLKSADSGANAPNYTHWLTGTVKIDEEKENSKKEKSVGLAKSKRWK